MSSFLLPPVLLPSPDPYFLLAESSVSDDMSLNRHQFVQRMLGNSSWVEIAGDCHIPAVRTIFSTYYNLVWLTLHERPFTASLIGSGLEMTRTAILALRTMRSLVGVATGAEWYREDMGWAARVGRLFLNQGTGPLSTTALTCNSLFRYAIPILLVARVAWVAGRNIHCLSQFRNGVLLRFVARQNTHSSFEFSATLDQTMMLVGHVAMGLLAERRINAMLSEAPKVIATVMTIAGLVLSGLGHWAALDRSNVQESNDIRRARRLAERERTMRDARRFLAGNGAVVVEMPRGNDPFHQGRPGMVMVSQETLRENPSFYFNKLYEVFFIEGHPSFRITFIDSEGAASPATDAGGPSRQFLMHLFHAALNQGMFSRRMGEWFPRQGRMEDFLAVGALFVYCLQTDAIVLPTDFSLSFFRALVAVPDQAIERNELTDAECAALCAVMDPEAELPGRVRGLLDAPVWTDEQRQMAAALVDRFDECDDDLLRAELIQVYEEYVQELGVRLLLPIARGMKVMLGEQGWQRERRRVQRWQRLIQGFVAEELEELPIAQQQVGQAEPNVVEKVEWLQRWWGNADIDKRRAFLVTATGGGSLGRDQRLQLDVYAATHGFPFFHTCAGQIDLPNYGDYETFSATLDLCTKSTTTEQTLGTGGFHGI